MKKLTNRIISIGFILYFIILTVERVISFSTFGSMSGDSIRLSNEMQYTFNIINIVCVILAFILYIKPLVEMIIYLFKKENYEFNYKWIISASMVLLVSGMMGTHNTISWLQFISYGFLIVSMLAYCINRCKKGENKLDSIFSFIYLTCFSMSIPVCHVAVNDYTYIPYYVFSFINVFVLIPVFGILLYNFFTDKNVFQLCPLFLMLILSGLAIGLNVTDFNSMNIFAAIFVIVSLIVYVIYKVIKIQKNLKENA